MRRIRRLLQPMQPEPTERIEEERGMTAVNVASTYLGFRWIDKFGRRKLAIGGSTGMIVFALVAALGRAAQSGIPRLVVIMIGLDFFIASFAIGVGGTGWTLQGEIFPTAVRGQAATIAAMVDWLAKFALIEANAADLQHPPRSD